MLACDPTLSSEQSPVAKVNRFHALCDHGISQFYNTMDEPVLKRHMQLDSTKMRHQKWSKSANQREEYAGQGLREGEIGHCLSRGLLCSRISLVSNAGFCALEYVKRIDLVLSAHTKKTREHRYKNREIFAGDKLSTLVVVMKYSQALIKMYT